MADGPQASVRTVAVSWDGALPKSIGEVDPHRAVLRADEPMAARGAGVFETLLVREGRACLLHAHLARLAASAATVGLPAPRDAEVAVTAALRRWPGGEAMLRVLYGAGRHGPRGFVTVSALPARVGDARRDGVAAVTVDRGVPADPPGPWSVATVKSMSYALCTAAQQHARRAGAQDAVLVSSDGYVLEGARAAVLLVPTPGELLTIGPAAPVLPSITARATLTEAARRGWRLRSGPVRVADLIAAQQVWLLSSVTLAARVHTLDGVTLRAGDAGGDVARLVVEAATA